MKIPVEAKPAVWGVVFGAVSVAIVGFAWGGWVTGSKSEVRAQLRAATAVTAALAPLCAAKFKGANDATANMAALQKVDSWSRGEFIEKGGWATMPGASAEQSADVAKACAALLLT
jgi:hypothetical protein